MKTLYLDCSMGAAGDMLTAALLELLEDPDAFLMELNTLGIPHVQFARKTVSKCGIRGTHITVTVHGEEEHSHDHEHTHDHHHSHEQEHSHEHNHSHEPKHSHGHNHSHNQEHAHEHHHSHEPKHSHGHHHSTLSDIAHLISHLTIPKKVADDVLAVYQIIARAESTVHGVPVSKIHFHEVGTLDAVADITAVCLLFHRLAADQIIASPIHVGSGQVHCAHGILPVPAPATALILQDCPIYGGSIRGELCTPTGAALLKYFVNRFDSMPLMSVQSIGYGMGKKDFEAANCIRAMLGETKEQTDVIYELNCNVDDMTAEQIGFALEQCFAAGAVEAFTIPIGMKKSRPGTLIRVLCSSEKKEALIRTIFKHTSTSGIRYSVVQRCVLDRMIREADTPFGKIRCKEVSGYGVSRFKYEYEDLARIAAEQDLSIEEVLKSL